MSAPTRTGIDFGPLFTPRSIAIVGSASPGKLAYACVQNLIARGYDGEIYPINREATAIEGRRGYASLAELPGVPDCAMLVVPAANCTDVVRACAEAGVRFAVIGASGFAELQTEAGIRRQREIEAIARASSLRLIGPNTNGILNATDRVALGYNASHGEAFPVGDVSIVSHSGALFDGVARRLAAIGTGLSKFVPVGNEADLTMLDFVEYLIEDPATRVIGLVVEGLGDGRRFRELAARARACGKPIVALKVGRSEVGAGAALAHSSRLAGGTRAYDALVRACGVASVTSVEALAGGCGLLSLTRDLHAVRDDRVVVVTSSGAGGALVADVATERGLALAGANGEWAEPAASALARLPISARVRNPIDLGTLGDWSLLETVFRETHAQADGPAIVYAHNPPREAMGDLLVRALVARRAASGAPIVVLSPGGLLERIEAALVAGGIPVFHDTATAFDSVMCYYAARGTAASAIEPPSVVSPDASREVAIPAGVGALSEIASAAFLRACGMPVVASATIAAPADLASVAAAAAYPVVLKALAPGVAHKHALGLVEVGIASSAALGAAYDRMRERARAAGFALDDVPFVVQPMIAGDLELIVGVSREATLGHFLVFGLGGVYAEILDEVVLFPIPADRARLRDGIEASRAGRLVRSVAADADVAIERVLDALDALQVAVAAGGERIASIDVNPLLVAGSRTIAVDALVVLR